MERWTPLHTSYKEQAMKSYDDYHINIAEGDYGPGLENIPEQWRERVAAYRWNACFEPDADMTEIWN